MDNFEIEGLQDLCLGEELTKVQKNRHINCIVDTSLWLHSIKTGFRPHFKFMYRTVL